MKELLKLFFLIYLISQILCQCPENCDCEEGETKCIKCHNEEFYGDSCDQPCNETTNCEKCQIDGTCYKCEGNKFKGPNCAEACNENCPSGECKFDDGVCEDGDCKDYLTYGDECNIPCSNINESCVECYRQGTCKSCSEDYHGIYCNITCPGCPQKQCDDNGVCEDKDGNCENEEYYGVNCEFTCKNIDPNCKKCNRDGICILCEEQLFGPKCEGNCSVCPNGLCDNNGECQDPESNCKDNATFGRDCQQPCSKIDDNCEKCSRDETCILCKNKAYFGKECKTPCYCPDQICEVDGTCDDLEADCFDKIFFGTKCDEKCNEGRDNCVECHRNGVCFTCTNETYFGKVL